MAKITGLTNEEVAERIKASLVNSEVKPPSKSIPQIIFSNLFTYFNFIFTVISILLFLVKSYRDLTFLPIIIANTLIGIIQEIRSKIVLDRLTVLHSPHITVIRNGQKVQIPTSELVEDDIAILAAGNQIPADGQVIDGNLTVNESLLTGEADEIHKHPGDTLMSGSYVVSGECYAKIEKVGRESYISKLTLEAKAIKSGEQSEIIRSLNRIVKIVGFIIIPIGLILFSQQYFFHAASAKTSVQAMVAAIIGMIPEGLFLLASTTLAISATKLALQKVLPQDMKSIETLARVDTLCIDKTGTITDGTMQVNNLHSLNSNFTESELKTLLSDFAHAQKSDNITMQALKDFFNTPTKQKPTAVSGFSSQYKYSGVSFGKKSYILGAPEFILRQDYEKYKTKIAKFSKQGFRTLIFGEYNKVPNGKALTAKFTPLCLITLTNPIRPSAPATFQYFYQQGVDIKVISGDDPLTVAQVAKQAGIKNSDQYIDCTTLTDDKSIQRAIKKYTVFGRVTPEQKRKFVRALKTQGHTVAMTGDGVNDILALKDADCSIAMASGSEATVQTAQLVLLESDFSKMPSVVKEGRKVVNNLERAGSLFLVKNIFSVLTALLSIIFGVVYPLIPAQVSLISMFTIGAPAFLLSQMPNTHLIKGSFIRNIISRALPGGITDALMVALIVVFGSIFHLGMPEISSIATFVICVVGLLVIYNISKPLDHYKKIVLSGCIIGFCFSLIFLRNLFSLTNNISIQLVVFCLIFTFAAIPVLHYFTKLANKIFNSKS